MVMSSEEYAARPTKCPMCQSTDIQACPPDVDGTEAWMIVECLDCGAVWTEMFRLVGYVNLKKTRCDNCGDQMIHPVEASTAGYCGMACHDEIEGQGG